jgi:hypothetical protein
MAEFVLQFPPEEIPALAKRYRYAGDSAPVAAGRRAKQRGYFSLSDFLVVCRWKAPRAEQSFSSNSEEEVKEATQDALRPVAEAERIESLTSLRGVGVPIASALLHFAEPERYPILDVRALESLGYESQRTQYSTSFWLRYLHFCRTTAERFHVSIRGLDKALWQWSRERE